MRRRYCATVPAILFLKSNAHHADPSVIARAKIWDAINVGSTLDGLTDIPREIREAIREAYITRSTTLEIEGDLQYSGAMGLPKEIFLLPWLRKLRVSKVPTEELPENLGYLTYLENLSIVDCSGLLSFPRSLGKLQKLKTLRVKNCESFVRFPAIIGKLNNLENIEINNCPSFERLPNEIGKIKLLKRIHLKYCTNLISIPESICRLPELKELELEGTTPTHRTSIEVKALIYRLAGHPIKSALLNTVIAAKNYQSTDIEFPIRYFGTGNMFNAHLR
jgi:hypothetical protein